MKRFRYLIMAGIFAGAFVYLTSVAKSRFLPVSGSMSDSPLFQESKVLIAKRRILYQQRFKLALFAKLGN